MCGSSARTHSNGSFCSLPHSHRFHELRGNKSYSGACANVEGAVYFRHNSKKRKGTLEMYTPSTGHRVVTFPTPGKNEGVPDAATERRSRTHFRPAPFSYIEYLPPCWHTQQLDVVMPACHRAAVSGWNRCNLPKDGAWRECRLINLCGFSTCGGCQKKAQDTTATPLLNKNARNLRSTKLKHSPSMPPAWAISSGLEDSNTGTEVFTCFLVWTQTQSSGSLHRFAFLASASRLSSHFRRLGCSFETKIRGSMGPPQAGCLPTPSGIPGSPRWNSHLCAHWKCPLHAVVVLRSGEEAALRHQ